MIDSDRNLRAGLEGLVPLPDETGDWRDALERAQARTRRRLRSLAALAAGIAALAAVVASPLGGAVVGGVSGFSDWLTGEPGTPASEAEQAAFERANERSWASFPQGTRLRRLIETKTGGLRYRLYGFKAGGELCLRLVAVDLRAMPAMSCAPIEHLERTRFPAVIVVTDHGFGQQAVPANADGYVPARASATFGIVADGVTAVELLTDEGRQRAIVASNAFLFIADRPRLGARVRRAFVHTADGGQTSMAVAVAPFGEHAPPAGTGGEPAGPTSVERTISGGRIGWVERREPRGEPAQDLFGRVYSRGAVHFARALQPNPDSSLRVVVAVVERDGSDELCQYLVTGSGMGGGCGPLANRSPLQWGLSTSDGGDQFSVLSGIASDEVARLELFLATGERLAIPLRDNAFVAPVARTSFPARLVAYDARGAVIATQLTPSDA